MLWKDIRKAILGPSPKEGSPKHPSPKSLGKVSPKSLKRQRQQAKSPKSFSPKECSSDWSPKHHCPKSQVPKSPKQHDPKGPVLFKNLFKKGPLSWMTSWFEGPKHDPKHSHTHSFEKKLSVSRMGPEGPPSPKHKGSRSGLLVDVPLCVKERHRSQDIPGAQPLNSKAERRVPQPPPTKGDPYLDEESHLDKSATDDPSPV
eukprot:Blabericola_migrator_1__12578@NODE_7_length_25668_cov_124_338502_g6_i0_p13_GENE_NODE_7_length_25668_cov_124_338502_g6_i0NODE_7_length_25668_cov_124_338502_g6_i0_p13_ORF_typecomplete_len202_score36_75DNA_meth_N/PF18284_1/0_32_NODE_7_length_25668_cov_124_338502_g6_i082328837